MVLSDQQRAAAERRIQEIKGEINAFLGGGAPTESQVLQWEKLLAESMTLQKPWRTAFIP